MKILLVHPGASVSTHDVYVGVRDGLQALGHEIYDYALDGRIEVSGHFLHFCYKRAVKKDPTIQKPIPADILYHAGEELVARALRVKPDVVLVVSAMYLHPDIFVLLRRAFLRIAVLFTESPYDDFGQAKILPWIDLGWTNERSSAKKLGCVYLPHAWTPGVHDAALEDDTSHLPSHDVVFVGTGFEERIAALSAVDWDGIDFGLYGSWDLLGSRHRLRQHIKGGYVDNRQTAGLYRNARIGLNLYRTSKGFGRKVPHVTDAESLNPRAYELAALGCFTISSPRAEVAEVFGDHVPVYTAASDLSGLIRRWLADADGRARHAQALPACVADATWHTRAQQMSADLERVLGRPALAATGTGG